MEIIFLSKVLEFICSFRCVSCFRTLWLKHNFLVVLRRVLIVLTRFHYFYIHHLLSNQLESSSFGLLLCLQCGRVELIVGGVLFHHLDPSSLEDLLGLESARLELIHRRPSPRISSTRAASIFPYYKAEGSRVLCSQVLEFYFYRQ